MTELCTVYTAFDIWSLGCTIRTLDLGRKNPDYKWRVLGASLGACLSSIVLSVSRAVFIVVGNLKGYLITDVIEVCFGMNFMGTILGADFPLVRYRSHCSKLAYTCPNHL